MELFNPKLDLAMNFDALTLSSQAKFKELREWKFLSRLKNQIKNYFNSSCKYPNISSDITLFNMKIDKSYEILSIFMVFE